MGNKKKALCLLLAVLVCLGASGSLALDVPGSKVANANTSFGFTLYKKLYKTDENLVFSPYSVSSALSMAALGARAQTRTQITKALQASKLSVDVIATGNESLIAMRDPALRVANALFIKEGAQIQPDFLELCKRFSAETRNVDFTDPKTIDIINNWVKENTNGMIDKMTGKYDEATLMSLINAIAFDGKWVKPFTAENTTPKPFYGSKVTTDAQMMYAHDTGVQYAETKSYQAVALPYEGNRYEMVIVLPKSGKKLGSVMNPLLSPKAFSKLVSSLRYASVNLTLPKFSVSSELGLKEILQKLGIKNAFTGKADFSGIAGKPGDYLISSILHKARIDVDEDGTKAAAATEVIISLTAMPLEEEIIEMNCDRPFFYAIRDRDTGMLIFMGAVNNL